MHLIEKLGRGQELASFFFGVRVRLPLPIPVTLRPTASQTLLPLLFLTNLDHQLWRTNLNATEAAKGEGSLSVLLPTFNLFKSFLDVLNAYYLATVPTVFLQTQLYFFRPWLPFFLALVYPLLVEEISDLSNCSLPENSGGIRSWLVAVDG